MVRETDGRKMGHQTLEPLQIRAAEQSGPGTSPEVTARALGLKRTTIVNWLGERREGAVDALRAIPVRGRLRKVQGRKLALLYELWPGRIRGRCSFSSGCGPGRR